MSDLAIRALGLGKKYELGSTTPYKSLRESLSTVLRRNANGGAAPNRTLWALRDVSFDIRRGDVVGVMGRNGAGKTTLLRLLSRITKPTTGKAILWGRTGTLLEVGTGFHPEMTGRENVFLSGSIIGMSRRELLSKFDEIVAFAEIERFVDTPVKRYSSGMYVRLAFSVAAHMQSEILLVDEVLAVGDAAFQKKCLGKMGDVAKDGRTILFVSHNALSMQALCNKGLLLEQGQLTFEGSIGEVVNRYLEIGREHAGEASWTLDGAPGREGARLKAVRVKARGETTGAVSLAEDFEIEVDHWNLEPNARRLISIHLHNSAGVCVLTSANMPSAAQVPDPWFERQYPPGVYRTTCRIPGFLLNNGDYSVSVFVNQRTAYDNLILVRDALTFTVEDIPEMRREYSGEWLGVVRPRLNWATERIE